MGEKLLSDKFDELPDRDSDLITANFNFPDYHEIIKPKFFFLLNRCYKVNFFKAILRYFYFRGWLSRYIVRKFIYNHIDHKEKKYVLIKNVKDVEWASIKSSLLYLNWFDFFDSKILILPPIDKPDINFLKKFSDLIVGRSSCSIYCTNYTERESDSMVKFIPIGMTPSIEARSKLRKLKKSEKIYANFSLGTNIKRRALIAKARCYPDSIDCLSIEGYGLYLGYPLSNEDYLSTLATYAMAFCPEGNGPDTYRIWDCLSVGVIPILDKSNPLLDNFSDLPVIVTNIYNLDEDNLDEIFRAYRNLVNLDFKFDIMTKKSLSNGF